MNGNKRRKPNNVKTKTKNTRSQPELVMETTDCQINLSFSSTDRYITKIGEGFGNCKSIRYCPFSKQVFVGTRDDKPLFVIDEHGKCAPFMSHVFSEINSIVFDSHHNIIISERLKYQLVFIDRKSKEVLTHQTIPGFSDPTAIAIDKDDNLYVADGQKIKFLKKKKENENDLTLPQYQMAVDLPIDFKWVYGIAFNRDGNLVFTDYSSAKVGIIDIKTNKCIADLAINSLTDIACDLFGNIIGGEWMSHGKMHKFKPQGNLEFDKKELPLHSTRAQYGFSSPTGVCFDPDNNLYMAESGTGDIWKFASPVVSGIQWPPFKVLFESRMDKESIFFQLTNGIPEITNLFILELISVSLLS